MRKLDNKRKFALLFIAIAIVSIILLGQSVPSPTSAQMMPLPLPPPAIPLIKPLTPAATLPPVNINKTASLPNIKAPSLQPEKATPSSILKTPASASSTASGTLIPAFAPSSADASLKAAPLESTQVPSDAPAEQAPLSSSIIPAVSSSARLLLPSAAANSVSSPSTQPQAPVTFSALSDSSVVPVNEPAQNYINTIIQLTDSMTGIPPSHYGHPGFNHLSFVYDVAVSAMMLKITGHQEEAERIMDYFADRLSMPRQQILDEMDTNNVLGVLKIMTPDAKTIGLVNAFNLNAHEHVGRGQLEFATTPGPMSFMIMAFLQINKEKYLPQAIQLGKAALLMQHKNGGIYDGDRFKDRVHTEPHLDAANAFYQLYNITKDKTWKTAGDKAAAWFKNNVYQPQSAEIYQGIWEKGPSTIFATDVYSWTMAGFMGDEFSADELDRLTNTLLTKCLSQVTLELPGGSRQTIIMSDFTDSRDPEVIKKRGSFHPMGSPEWTGGVILALQKNAVRLWNKGLLDKARFYKGMAEYLTSEVLKSRYKIHGMTMFPYATGQGIEVGHGWKTPYFYVKDPAQPVAGGSLIGGWPIMPMNGFNPFILGDNYFKTYQKINVPSDINQKAVSYINTAAAAHRYTEAVLTKSIDKRTQIIEPGFYNQSAWLAFNKHNYQEAVFWAQKVTANTKWVKLALNEERIKMSRIGGLIDYTWGEVFENNESMAQIEIRKYPLLNEVATAMWILANSNYQLKQFDASAYWIRRIIQELPLHQIAHVLKDNDITKMDMIDGYWNALVSWAYNPSKSPMDDSIGRLIGERKIALHVPATINVDSIQFPLAFHAMVLEYGDTVKRSIAALEALTFN